MAHHDRRIEPSLQRPAPAAFSYEAAMALIRMEPERWGPMILSQLDDAGLGALGWERGQMKHLLYITPAPISRDFFVRRIFGKRMGTSPMFFTMASFSAQKSELSRMVLENPHRFTPEEIAWGIKNIEDPKDWPLIEGFKIMSEWFIHLAVVQSIQSLHIDDAGQIPYLKGFLHSEHWWLRSRAAEVLLFLLGGPEREADLVA